MVVKKCYQANKKKEEFKLSKSDIYGVISGVFYVQNRDKYIVSITRAKKICYLGHYKNYNEAVLARYLAEKLTNNVHTKDNNLKTILEEISTIDKSVAIDIGYSVLTKLIKNKIITDTICLKGYEDERMNDCNQIGLLLCYPTCSFKCLKELNLPISICQNSELTSIKNKYVPIDNLIEIYNGNNLTNVVIHAGFEPFDTFSDLLKVIITLSKNNIPSIIFTGYEENELFREISLLKNFGSITCKFGRFIPNQAPHFDEVLGVNLISDNQYGKVIC